MDFATLEWDDDKMIASILAMKSSSPGMKVIASVGGWNFPSSYFSRVC